MLKDLNFQEKQREEQLVILPEVVRAQILEKVRFDSDFLCSLGIMDYSLLLVIETVATNLGNSFSTRNRYLHGDKLYHVGIIDYLQFWNFSKKMEKCFKTCQISNKQKDISAQPPSKYCHRF